MTRRRMKTETAKQMTKIKTGRGSSLELGPPDVGTIGSGMTTDSEKENKNGYVKFSVVCLKYFILLNQNRHVLFIHSKFIFIKCSNSVLILFYKKKFI